MYLGECSKFISYYKKVVQLSTMDKVKKIGRHIKQFVTNVSDDKTVTLADGTQLKGDIVVCATGLKLDEFWKPTTAVTTQNERINNLVQLRQNVSKAKSVLIVGGGVIGVEMAAEIVTKYPKAEVHIVQATDRLLPYQVPKAAKVAYNFLKNRKCKIHLNATCEVQDGGYVLKSKGNNAALWDSKYAAGSSVFRPDVVVQCTGGKPITDYLPSKAKNSIGQAMVDEYLEVVEMPGVYAIGDINDIKGVKTGQGATAQTEYLFDNLLEIAKGNNRSKSAVKKFTIPAAGVIVSLGYWKAAADFGGSAFVGPFGTGSNTFRFIRRGIEKMLHDSI